MPPTKSAPISARERFERDLDTEQEAREKLKAVEAYAPRITEEEYLTPRASLGQGVRLSIKSGQGRSLGLARFFEQFSAPAVRV